MPAFLSDWTFWSFVVAALALWLSQIPPLKYVFQTAKLELEVFPRVSLSHRIGRSNFQIYLTVFNVGGRSVRLRSITLTLYRNGELVGEHPVINYFQDSSSNTPVLFTPKTLPVEAEWSHNCWFFVPFSRDHEREFRTLSADLQTDIAAKARAQRMADPNDTTLVVAEPENIAPLRDFFDREFELVAGEYRMQIELNGDVTSVSKDYDFTIFESDERFLRDLTEDYKYGAGVYFDRQDKSAWLSVDIRERGGTT